MMCPSNRFIHDALQLARQLTLLADNGEAASRDDGCVVLYGIIRDCAYRIRGRAEREREVHRVMGIWEEEGSSATRKTASRGAVARDPATAALDRAGAHPARAAT